MTHGTVTVRHPDGYPVDLDRGVVELVQAMWDVLIATTQSCEDPHGDGYAWVAFESFEHLRRLVTLVGARRDDRDGSLWRRMTAHDIASPDSTPELAGEWRYRVLPLAPSRPDEPWQFAAAVEFPRSDAGEMIARLRAHGASAP